MTLPRWQTATPVPIWAAKSIVRLVWRIHWLRSRASTEEGSNRLGAAWVTPAGSGQKLWTELTRTVPSSRALRTPGIRLMRTPWLSSTWLNPSSAISAIMA